MPIRLQTQATVAYFQPLLIKSLFESAMASGSSAEIVYRDVRRHGYGEFGRRVHALASALSDKGCESGTVVAVLDWDSHRYQEAYFAVPMMGAVLQMVNPRLAPDQVAYVLGSCGAKILLCHEDFMPLLAAVRAAIPSLRHVVAMSDNSAADEYEPMLLGARAHFTFEDFDENAVATLFHTSGTTGLPKAVSFTHRQLVLQTLALMGTLGAQPAGQDFGYSDVYMPLTPLFHVHAWGMPYLATMMGVKQVYPGRYEPARIIGLKVQESVTFSHCVPTILQMILGEPSAAGALDDWKMVIGGSALPRALHLAAVARGITAFAGYGMSETAPLIAVARYGGAGDDPELRATALTSAGHPAPLVLARINDDHGGGLAHGSAETGELVLRAPWLTASYVGDEAASETLWDGGWLHTQDAAAIGPEGTLVIRDRIKDVIKTGGEWVSAAAIEDLLLENPAVGSAALVGIPDEKWGERPVAFVIKQDGAILETSALQEMLHAKAREGLISPYAVPDHIIVIDSLPLTSVGKIDKLSLRKRALQEALQTGSS